MEVKSMWGISRPTNCVGTYIYLIYIYTGGTRECLVGNILNGEKTESREFLSSNRG